MEATATRTKQIYRTIGTLAEQARQAGFDADIEYQDGEFTKGEYAILVLRTPDGTPWYREAHGHVMWHVPPKGRGRLVAARIDTPMATRRMRTYRDIEIWVDVLGPAK